MCDTIGRIANESLALFAKNSDRSPNEPQVAEYRPAHDPTQETLRATYLEIKQAQRVFGTLISRPVWMWGAEMGVNEHGVCIGNEAVFTKGRYEQTGLTGMDLTRLGLERGDSARAAMEIIIDLLERYGQGGNCGYDHSFFYDNSFLILDRKEVLVLETAGRHWAYRSAQSGSISNRLSVNTNADKCSEGQIDFSRRHLEPVYSLFSGSAKRLAASAPCAESASSVKDLFAALRQHRIRPERPLCRADVASVCMHAGGAVGDHTTASMAVELGEKTTVWLTGSSLPCVSLFKPWEFGAAPCPPVFAGGQFSDAVSYWLDQEDFRRAVMGKVLPAAFYEERDALEDSWVRDARDSDSAKLASLSREAARQESEFLKRWKETDFGPASGKRAFLRYWKKKTQALKQPAQEAVSGM